ncbi:MAG: 6-phosphogluconolactonase [Bacteroidota bacterium]
MKAHRQIYPDNPAVARAIAQQLPEWLPKSGPMRLAISGGSTPKLLFELLATEFKEALDWSRLHLFWVDERCVPPDHAQSNYRMTREALLDQVPIPAEQIHRMQGESAPEAEADRYGKGLAEQLPQANGLPVFDLILLGMGSDGHTASIFPPQMELLTDARNCAVGTHPESGQQRITLTGPVIQAAKRVAFLVTGASKTEVVAEIFEQTGNWQSYPAAHIAPAGELHWFLDEAAAGA